MKKEKPNAQHALSATLSGLPLSAIRYGQVQKNKKTKKIDVEMPTTVQQLFDNFNIKDIQQVKWGTNFNEKNQGIYIVSTSRNPQKDIEICDLPNFEDEQIIL
ncbi:MAG: hypothetical protein Q8T08_01465, partial [Ignavibacteria bacterium]|nr:hypothetical protein [Ignavibacteria bacterium]